MTTDTAAIERMLAFLDAHSGMTGSEIALRFGTRTDLGFDVRTAALQADARKKAARKIPSFLAGGRFVFPTSLSAEQASDERVARYHSSLLPEGASVTDMTAGLGIDAMTLAVKAGSVTAIELDQSVAEALLWNSRERRLTNFSVINGDSAAMLLDGTLPPSDVIFIDPARRGDRKERLYALSDCTPDISMLAPTALRHSPTLMVKASPMLDLAGTLRELPEVAELHVVTVRGECKEVLAISRQAHKGEVKVMAVETDAHGDTRIAEFCAADMGVSPGKYAQKGCETVGRYLYEPDAAIMKIAPWNALCSRFDGLEKLDANTHLFISDELYSSFPGRVVRVERELGSGDLKRLKGERMEVISRNHPLSSDALRKRAGVKEGQQKRLVAARIAGTPAILLCEPV